MKILMVNDMYKYGGAEVIFKGLANFLRNLGHIVVTVTREDLMLDATPQFKNLRFQSVRNEKYFHNLIKRERPNIVHCHNLIDITLSPLKVSTGLGIPSVLTVHDYLMFCPKRNLIDYRGELCEAKNRNCFKCYWVKPVRRLFYWIKLWAKTPILNKIGSKYFKTIQNQYRNILENVQLVTVSNEMRYILLKHGGYNSKTILNGIPVSKQEMPTQTSPLSKFILHLSRLSYEKGIDTLIKASKKIKGRVIAFNYIDPEYVERVDRNKIEYFGYASKQECIRALASCSLLVSCSIWHEPFGLDVVEAMMYGKPVVATNIGGHKDTVVSGETGLLVEPNNVEELVDAINFLLENESAAKSFGENGRKRFKKYFTIKRCADEYLKLYQGLMKKW